MAKQTIDVGSYASDGTGDPLRDAFTKINENFTELYSGNVQITAANVLVESVAGRIGNVVLTVNDVAQAASKSYVNAAIASNLANVTGSITNSLSADITAANLVIADHESRITSIESDVSQNTLDIANLTTDKADLTAVYNIVEQYVSANAALASVASVNANVAAANLRIAAIGTQSNNNSQNITVLFANAGAQGRQIDVVNANVAAANLRIETLTTNVDNFNGDFLAVQANSAVQAQEINELRANITAANAEFISANTIQRLDIQSLQYDTAQIILSIGSLGLSIIDLSGNDAAITSNIGSYQTWANGYMASQTVSINSLRANITAANAAISALEYLPLEVANLESNAGIQASEILAIQYLDDIQNDRLNILTANSIAQDTQINLLNANLTAANLDIATLLSNSASQAIELDLLTSNSIEQTYEINSLWSNIGLYVGNLNTASANIGAYQTWANASNSAYRLYANANAAAQSTLIDFIISNLIATTSNVDVALDIKANISGETFTGNVQVPYLLANSSRISSNIQIGSIPSYSYSNVGGSFTESINGSYGVVIQNTNTGINGSSDLTMLPDDGLFETKRLRLWVNGSGASGDYSTPTYPEGAPGQVKFPSDGGVSVFGGNAIFQSDNGVFLAANTAVAVLYPDGTFSVDKLSLGGAATFNSMTVSGGMSSTTGVAMALDGNDVNVTGNIKVSGGRIRSAGNIVMTLSGDDVIANNGLTVGKDLVVGGDIYAESMISAANVDIYSNTTHVTITEDRNLHLRNANLKFSDGTIQQTAITDVPALYANIGTLFLGNVTTNANLGAYQLDTNANLGAYQLDTNANIGTLFLGNASTNANLGAYRLSNNANVGTLFLGNASTNANLGAFQTYSNSTVAAMQANIGTIVSVTVPAINANVTAANAAIQTLSANIGTLVGGAGAALDTLLELGNALGNSSSFSSTVVNWLSNITANVTAANTAITTINANLGAFQLYANANIGTLFLGNASTNANLGAYQTYANTSVATTQANLGAFQLYANANIGTLFLGNASTNANLGAFQLYANANIGTLFLGNASTNANLGAFQTYANSTVAAIQANLGAYQTYANANAATQATTIDTLLTQVYSNANVTAYLVTYSGNIAVGNIQITGNINYTPNTAGNYNQTITNMQLALDELAARVKALGG